MRRRTESRPSHARAPRHFGWAFGLVAVGLLGSMVFVGTMLFQQTAALSHHLGAVDPIVNGNVRVLSQAQRELLRLDTLLALESVDAEAAGFHRDLVSQRMREASLSYQVNTLGSDELLGVAESLAARWHDAAVPLLSLAVEDDDVATAELRELLRELELGFNRLVSEAEISRRTNAATANDATGQLLGETRRVLVGGSVAGTLLLIAAVIGIAGFVRFDHQRARTTARAAELNQELRILSEVASRTNAMVVITDADGAITWVNDAFVELTGYDSDEVIGRRPGALLQGEQTDPATIAMMSTRLAAGEGFTCEVLNYTKQGTAYWVRIEVQPVIGDDGVLTNFIAVESDITADREAQQRLRRAKEVAEETAAVKTNFLASMSHEIRTPLNAVIGFTGLLERTTLDDQQREYVRTAASSGRLLLGVINDILNYSALEFGGVVLESRAFRLEDLLSQAIELLGPTAGEKGLRLSADVEHGTPEVLRGDATRLRQVLVNLVGNAVKFTDVGSVDVRVRTVGRGVDGWRLEVDVADTGIGIPSSRIDRLFQPFSQVDASTTRRFGGTGLGLAICHDLVSLMDGTIRVQSAPDVGTTVTVELVLPEASPAEVAATPVAPPEDGMPAPNLRVLLVEDDAVNQTVAIHMLRQLGLVPDVVANGVECLEALRRGRYDTVLMDVHMPEMDGPTATARIVEEFDIEDRPLIVAMTANAMPGDRERFLSLDMDDYVAKPVQLEDLARVLREVTRTPRWDAESTQAPRPVRQVRPGQSSVVVDTERFAQLVGSQDPGFLLQVVDVLLEESGSALPRLRAAVWAGQHDRARGIAGRLADAAAACAAGALVEALAGLLAGSLVEENDALARVETELQRIDRWRSSFRAVADQAVAGTS